jgi:hypothetical protein
VRCYWVASNWSFIPLFSHRRHHAALSVDMSPLFECKRRQDHAMQIVCASFMCEFPPFTHYACSNCVFKWKSDVQKKKLALSLSSSEVKDFKTCDSYARRGIVWPLNAEVYRMVCSLLPVGVVVDVASEASTGMRLPRFVIFGIWFISLRWPTHWVCHDNIWWIQPECERCIREVVGWQFTHPDDKDRLFWAICVE